MAEVTVLDLSSDKEQFVEPTGRAMLDGGECLYADAIKPGDLVAANFDVKHAHTGGGLYLVQATDGSKWRACRRMMRVPAGIQIDQDGCGNWITVPSMEAIGWHIVGTIETVYKPTCYQ